MSSKQEVPVKKVLLEDVLKHPEATFLMQIKQSKTLVIDRQPLISEAGLAKLVSQLTDGPVALKPPVMQLSAQHPYDSKHGFVEMYMPGRWDTSTDQIYMDPFVTNPMKVGEWTGSVGYITFHPPSSGTYVMVVHFYGYQISMRLSGPGGTATSASDSNVSTAVAMLFSSNSGTAVFFDFVCTGIYLGFIQSIQVFQL